MQRPSPIRRAAALLLGGGLLATAPGASPVFAQAPPSPQAPPPAYAPVGITVGPGSVFTVGVGSHVATVDADVHVMEGGALVHQGELFVGRDLTIEGELRTVIGGDDAAPAHGRIYVGGRSAYWGTLAVALARDARFTEARDFVLATQTRADGQLAASQLPGARWTSRHSDETFLVRLGEVAGLPDDFSLAVDGARDEDQVVIDWVAYADARSLSYHVERYYAEGDWRQVGEVASVGAETRAAYYSTKDRNLPADPQTLRYRIRLADESGTWHYSEEVLIDLGRSPRLVAFPNPARPGGRVRLLGVDTERGPERLRLMGVDGRVLADEPLAPGDALEIALSDVLPAGSYALELTYADGESQSVGIFVVQ